MITTQISRRAFLKGCLMTAALAALPVALIKPAPLEVYGRSPAMVCLPDFIDLQARLYEVYSKIYAKPVLLNGSVHGVSRAYETV